MKTNSNDNKKQELSRLINQTLEIIIDLTKQNTIQWEYLEAFDFSDHENEYESLKEFAKKQMLNGTVISESASYVTSTRGSYYFCLCLKSIESKQTKSCVLIVPKGRKTANIYAVDTAATSRLYNILKFTLGSNDDDEQESLESVKSVLDSLNSSQSD